FGPEAHVVVDADADDRNGPVRGEHHAQAVVKGEPVQVGWGHTRQPTWSERSRAGGSDHGSIQDFSAFWCAFSGSARMFSGSRMAESSNQFVPVVSPFATCELGSGSTSGSYLATGLAASVSGTAR